MVLLRDIFSVVEEMAPPLLAEEWDNTGLQIGDPDKEAKGILVALDPSIGAVDKASDCDFNLLLTHHPLFMSGLKSINTTSYSGRVITSAIMNNVTIFAAHTNLDSAGGGISDILSGALGIIDVVPIKRRTAAALQGPGRIGTLGTMRVLGEIVGLVKKALNIETLRVLGDMDRTIQKVAVCGGSGGDLIELAAELGAELFISGDIRYHQARRAEELGLAVIDAGHFSTEKVAIRILAVNLGKRLHEQGANIPVSEFQGEQEPFISV